MSLLSLDYFALAATTVLLVSALTGPARQAVLLTANVVFLTWLLVEPVAVATAAGFCLLGFVFARLIQWRPWTFGPALVAYILLFVYVKQYEFLYWVLPAEALAHTINTIGLSFLFFKVAHVLIEARSATLGSLHFGTFLNYGLCFSTFMMGPIQRYQDFHAQWNGVTPSAPPTFQSCFDSFLRVLMGLFKAYVLAVHVAPYALPHGADVRTMSAGEFLVGAYAFYLFLYLNFAGYCDIAIGISHLLGVRPPENFDKPFLARDISEFWMRFHRSLTVWLANYVFNPAYRYLLTARGFASRPLLAANVALMLTMLVSGLWHGTTWNFLLFGLVQGVFFVMYRTVEALAAQRWGRQRWLEWRRLPTVQAAGMVLTFNAVAVSLALFRIDLRPILLRPILESVLTHAAPLVGAARGFVAEGVFQQ